MNRLCVTLAAVLMAATVPMTGAQQTAADAEKLMARARQKGTIDGDLKGAIEDYKKAVAAATSNRALAAHALLGMAECYQKLGEREAQVILERIAREYADQTDVAIVARARLAAAGSVARVKGDRSVWTGPDADGFGTISPDGRFLTFTDWADGAALALRDLSTGTSRRLTSGGGTQFSALSRDGKHVAYQWRDDTVPRDVCCYELRVARLQPTGLSDSRRLVERGEVTSTAPYDWSPDGKWIAATVARQDGTNQIALVAVQDGSLRILKSLDWRGPEKIFFSPDGRYVAYDLQVSDASEERHVFVMATDGTRESAVVVDTSQNVIMGWAPDGGHVLFASNRSGSFGLWAVAVSDGKPVGPATLLKSDVASSWSLGVTSSGTMYVWKYASPIAVQAAAIDLAAGKLAPGPALFHRFIGSRGRPEWSPDGKQLAYQSCAPLGSGPCTMWIRSIETGQLRELKVKLRYFFFPRWSPNGRELIVRGTDMRGRNNGLYRIDVQTGETTLVATPYPGQTMPQWGADSTHVYYRRDSSLIARNLDTGEEREAVRIPTGGVGHVAVSPDGQQVAYVAGESSGTRQIFVLPLAGGAPRSVFTTPPQQPMTSQMQWTLDGRAIVVATMNAASTEQALWLIDPAGAEPRKLDIDMRQWQVLDGVRLDPSGKRLAFVAASGERGLEIRALENFLPARAATPSAPRR